jgi:hypothetical protein
MKDGGNNFKTMVTTLKSIINHGPLKTFWVYEGIYFGHVMFKAC